MKKLNIIIVYFLFYSIIISNSHLVDESLSLNSRVFLRSLQELRVIGKWEGVNNIKKYNI